MYFRPYGVVSVSKSSLAVFLLIVHPSQTGLEGQAIARMMSNGWIDSWRHSFPRINRQVEIGQYLAVNSPIPRRAHVGLKEQRSHVPVLSQLGDKPCLLQLVAALCILRLLLSLRIAIASFSFSFFFFILFSRGFFLYLLYLFWRLSFLFRLLSVHLVSSIAAVPRTRTCAYSNPPSRPHDMATPPVRQWGVTPPITTTLPTPDELAANDDLISELKSQNNFEAPAETDRR